MKRNNAFFFLSLYICYVNDWAGELESELSNRLHTMYTANDLIMKLVFFQFESDTHLNSRT